MLIVTFVSAGNAESAGDTPPALGTWRSLAAAPTKRTEVVAAALQGKIYVVGGFAEPGFGNVMNLAITDMVEMYDPSTNRWTTKAPLPAKLHHAGAAVIGDRLYIVGGYTQSFLSVWHPVATLYVYDPSQDRWTEGLAMPTARGALAVTDHAGKIFAIGGYDGARNSAAVEVYDPAGNSWRIRASLPTARDHLAAVSTNGKVYAIGGRLNGDYGRNLSVTESYDPATNGWSRAADMPTARSGITAGVIQNIVYVLGGEAPGGTFRANEAYFPQSDRWQAMADMPTSRHGLGSAVVDGRLYAVTGGTTPGGSFSDVNEMFRPALRRTTHEGPMSQRNRAAPEQVGAVMAVLATFDEGKALPPESSPEANQLIKALIQFQGAFMKSSDATIRQFFEQALETKLGSRASEAVVVFRANGWTSESLEAVAEYASMKTGHPERLEEALREYNLRLSDLDLLVRIFHAARHHLADEGKNIHQVYAMKRREMPGAHF
ncbi:MAG: Kelch repeat-containing protein [Nitrospiraceae bacterium]